MVPQLTVSLQVLEKHDKGRRHGFVTGTRQNASTRPEYRARTPTRECQHGGNPARTSGYAGAAHQKLRTSDRSSSRFKGGHSPDDEDTENKSEKDDHTSGNTPDFSSTVKTVLDNNPASGPQGALLDSLTQAFTTTKATSPAIEGKIAELIDSMLMGGLLAETVKERVEKHPLPENCKYLSVTMVNEKIWDLSPRKSRVVDLGFQRVKKQSATNLYKLWVQKPLLHEISALTELAGKLVKDINDGKTPNTRHVLDVMDSVAMLGNANWKLNMKRRELIKPDLNPPYTRLCKEDIELSTKQKQGNRCKSPTRTAQTEVQYSTYLQQQQQNLVTPTCEKVRKNDKFDNIPLEKYRMMTNNFQAGQLNKHLFAWESLTSDPFTLDAIKHYHIEFESDAPWQVQEPRQIHSSILFDQRN